jgi:thymidylate kinase
MLEQRVSTQPLETVERLCRELAAAGIDYCHWKSNAAIGRSASGENDLDLLIGRGHEERFTAILGDLGFKRALDPPGQRIPGIDDYYGLDCRSGRLVHVHAHYRLVVGHDATKNYHLPVEDAYLAAARPGELFRVASVEFELILLVLRLTIKHSTLDARITGHGRISGSERAELDYLSERASPSRVDELLRRHFAPIDPALFRGCVETLRPDVPFPVRSKAARKLLAALRPYARRPRWLDVSLKLVRRVTRPLQSRLFPHSCRKRFAGGGRLVAVVGGDGSGKTTAIEGLRDWLSEDFDAIRVHMGKPRWSAATVAVRALVKAGRTLGFYPFVQADDQYTHDSAVLVFPGYPWLIREICTARDRLLTYRKARRFAARGGIVITDRYPVAQITFMDGPQIARMTANLRPGRLTRFLIRLEEGFYRRIPAPDLTIVLRLDPETAVRRKTDETPESVRARSGEIWGIDWSGTNARVVDASGSREQVLSCLKELLWHHL